MIVPLLKMRYKYMVWLQSESDVCASDDKCEPQRGAKYYSCAVSVAPSTICAMAQQMLAKLVFNIR
jgi:hypothetical protein